MNVSLMRGWRWATSPMQIVALAVALAVLLILPGLAADISYVYDDAGRLIAVIDPASDTAIYAYDSVGNLTGITQQASSTLAVLHFTPSSGPVGATVTIYGTGFSTTPASNTVKFNGTTATVATATATVLTTTVPEGATTGTISVTVASVTATSAASFTVGTGGAPTFSSFSSAVGGYGDTITLTGTNDTDQQPGRLYGCHGGGGHGQQHLHHGAGAQYRANRPDLDLDHPGQSHERTRVLCRAARRCRSRCPIYRPCHRRWVDRDRLDHDGEQEWPHGV